MEELNIQHCIDLKDKTFSEDIRKRLLLLVDYFSGKNKKTFAKKAGIGYTTFLSWLKDENASIPPSDKLMRICLKFDISPEWLLCGSGEILKWGSKTSPGSTGEIWMRLYKINEEYLKSRLPKVYAEVLKQRIDSSYDRKMDSQGTAKKLLGSQIDELILEINKWIKMSDIYTKSVEGGFPFKFLAQTEYPSQQSDEERAKMVDRMNMYLEMIRRCEVHGERVDMIGRMINSILSNVNKKS